MTQLPVDVQAIRLGKAVVLAINTSQRARDRLIYVWEQIPIEDRAKIEALWTNLDRGRENTPCPVFICLEGQVHGKAFGGTSWDGFLIRINGQAIEYTEANDNDRIDKLIKHELAHVFDYAINAVKDRGDLSDETKKMSSEADERMEEFANNTATRWEFELLQIKRTD